MIWFFNDFWFELLMSVHVIGEWWCCFFWLRSGENYWRCCKVVWVYGMVGAADSTAHRHGCLFISIYWCFEYKRCGWMLQIAFGSYSTSLLLNPMAVIDKSPDGFALLLEDWWKWGIFGQKAFKWVVTQAAESFGEKGAPHLNGSVLRLQLATTGNLRAVTELECASTSMEKILKFSSCFTAQNEVRQICREICKGTWNTGNSLPVKMQIFARFTIAWLLIVYPSTIDPKEI